MGWWGAAFCPCAALSLSTLCVIVARLVQPVAPWPPEKPDVVQLCVVAALLLLLAPGFHVAICRWEARADEAGAALRL